MNYKKIILFSSVITFIGIASLTGFLITNNSSSNNFSFKNQSENIRFESNEKEAVNKESTESKNTSDIKDINNKVKTEANQNIVNVEKTDNQELSKIETTVESSTENIINENNNIISEENNNVISNETIDNNTNEIIIVDKTVNETIYDDTKTEITNKEIINNEDNKNIEEINKEPNVVEDDVLNNKEEITKEEIISNEEVIKDNDISEEKRENKIGIDTNIIESEIINKSNLIIDNTKNAEKNEEINIEVLVKEDETDIESENKQLQDIVLKPETPTIINIEKSSNSIAIYFADAINATGYSCVYGKDVDKLDNSGNVISTLTGNQCFIDNLEEGVNYYIQLSSVNKDLFSKSEIRNVKTSYLQPEKSELISSVVNDNNIKVSYSLSANATRYTCLYKKSNEDEWKVSGNLVVDENNIYCELDNLEENVEYEFKLSSINGDNIVDSEITKISTKYKKPELPVVKNIDTKKDSIDIVLNKSKNATSYICRYGTTKENINNFGKVVIEDDKVICGMNNLGSSSTYFVKLYAYNHDVYNESETFEVTTNGLSELSVPVLTSTNSNSSEIDVVFNIYKGNPDIYTCLYGESKNSLNKTGKIINDTNSQATCRLSNLNEGEVYYVKLIAENNDFKKESEIYEVKTEFNNPTKSVLKNSSSTEQSITAQFSIGANVKEYKCYYGTSDSNINIPIKHTIKDQEINCSVSGLNEGTNYYIKVVSINGDKEISSDVYQITTNMITPSKVVLLNQYQTQNTIKVLFSLSNFATEYTAYYGKNKDNLVKVPFTINEDNIEIEVNNLKENTSYFFMITASNKNVLSIDSEIVEIKTLNEVIDTPILINSISTESTATLNFNTTEDLDLYICYYGTNKESLDNTVNASKISDNTRQCVIDNLKENTSYFFKLNAIKNGNIVSSEIIEVKTKYKTPSVPILNEVNSTSDSVNVKFNVSGNITNYICKFGTDINNINTTVNSVKNNNIIECDIQELLNKTNYYVKLEVINGDKSAQSEPILVTTKYKLPSKPIWESTNTTENKITSIYSLSDDATDYICYYGTDKNDITKLGNISIENNKIKCEYADLEENTEYYHKVVATNHNEVFTESDIKNTKTSYSNPETPTVNKVDSNENSITITYSKVKANSYICYYGIDSLNLNMTGRVSKDSDGNIICKANNLEENSNYYFKLVVNNGDKISSSIVTKASTKQKVDESAIVLQDPESISITENNNIGIEEYVPKAPVNIDITKDFENIILTYNTEGYSQNFKCYIGVDENNQNIEGEMVDYDGKQMCAFTKLNPATRYFIRIDNNYNDKVNSTITEVTTDSKNDCVGTGAPIEEGLPYGTKVNSTCGVAINSLEAKNAEQVATKLANIDKIKVLKDYPEYDVLTYYNIIPLYKDTETIYGYDIDIVLHSKNSIYVVYGEYYLRQGNREWTQKLPFDE